MQGSSNALISHTAVARTVLSAASAKRSTIIALPRGASHSDAAADRNVRAPASVGKAQPRGAGGREHAYPDLRMKYLSRLGRTVAQPGLRGRSPHERA